MQIVSEVYQRLYHYTNFEGLKGILGSQSLWATNYQYLNDEKEIVLFMEEKLPEFIYPYVEKIYLERFFKEPRISNNFFKEKATDFFNRTPSFEDIVKNDVKLMGPCFFEPLNHQIYICSFSGETKNKNIDENGLLSQWRSYGDDGGYCIILNTKKLEDLLAKEYKKSAHSYLLMGDVVYSDDNEKYAEEFKNYLEDIAIFVSEMANSIGKKEPKITKGDPLTAFLNCITRYKHFGFKEEKEVRLVSLLYGLSNDKRIEKKVFSRNNVDYINVFIDLEDPLPIEEIIVGPHKDKIKRAEELQKIVKETDIKISISSIPYVGKRAKI